MAVSDLPKILICTPELAFLPEGDSVIIEKDGRTFNYFSKKQKFLKGGGLADMTSTLVIALKQKGVNVGVTIPHLKRAAEPGLADLIDREVETLGVVGLTPWQKNLFLVEDDYFSSLSRIYEDEGKLFSLAFQRGVLNSVIPTFNPALVHTHDWMTGFIGPLSHPNIKSLHTIHNFHTNSVPMKMIYDFGLPLYNASKLFLGEGYDFNKVDFQLSGIAGSDYVNTPSQEWLLEIARGEIPFDVNPHFPKQMRKKFENLHAFSVPNAPDSSYAPEIDSSIYYNFSLEDVIEGKKINKKRFQQELGLVVDENAPLIVWTNRADSYQKGIQHLDALLPSWMQNHQNPGLQVAIIADGEYSLKIEATIKELERQGFKGRIIIKGYDEDLERKAYAAGDALLNCSLYAPCELVQMKGMKYGCLPIVRWTGGLKDTVVPVEKGGFGYVFLNYDANGLDYAKNNFLSVFHNNPTLHEERVKNGKKDADKKYTVDRMADGYISGYEGILETKVHE